MVLKAEVCDGIIRISIKYITPFHSIAVTIIGNGYFDERQQECGYDVGQCESHVDSLVSA